MYICINFGVKLLRNDNNSCSFSLVFHDQFYYNLLHDRYQGCNNNLILSDLSSYI